MLYCFLNFFLHICFFGWAVSLLWHAGAAVFSVTCRLQLQHVGSSSRTELDSDPQRWERSILASRPPGKSQGFEL